MSTSNKTRTRPSSPVCPNIPVSCSICDKLFDRDKSLIPVLCLKEHGIRAHRICQECWWNTFAKEDAPHGCPGCKRALPLTRRVKDITNTTGNEVFVILD
jgi:hypothetical protein